MEHKFDLSYGPEWAALEWLCLGVTGVEVTAFLDLLETDDFDIDRLTGHAVRHNMAAHLGDLVDHPQASGRIHKRVREHLRTILRVTQTRNAMLAAEALRATAALEEAGLTVATTKGVVFQFLLYDGRGTRSMADIDLMILPEEREKVSTVLRALGYEFADYDQYTHTLQPMSRAMELRYKFSPDHLPRLLALREDPLLPVVSLDCAFSLTWANCPWQVDMARALAQVDRVSCSPMSHSTLPSLRPAYAWLFAVLHLFREAWVRRTAEEQFTTMSQFCDVIRFWNRFEDVLRNDVPSILQRENLWYPAAWVCEHVDRTLNTSICTSLGLDSILSEAALNTVIGPNEAMFQWPGTMRERLWRATAPPLTPAPEAVSNDQCISPGRRVIC